MAWAMLLTVTLVCGALVLRYRHGGAMPVDRFIVAALLLGLAMLLATGAMGLWLAAGQ